MDASVVVQAISGAASLELTNLVIGWKLAGEQFVAPSLIGYEVFNSLHRIRLSDPSKVKISAAARMYSLFEVELFDDLGLHERAAEIAEQFAQPAVYDSPYLALAERLGIDFWTSDSKLVKAVSLHFDWVRFAP